MAIEPDYSVPTEQITVSEQIVRYLQTTLQSAEFNPYAPGTPLFGRVIRGKLDDIQRKDTPCAAIEEGPEKTIQTMWPITFKTFRVFINFKVYHEAGHDLNEVGVDQFAMIRYYFGRIVNLFITDDIWLGGLATDVVEAGNTPEVNGYADTEPGGTVYFDITYRHNHGDMFTGV